MTCLRKSLGILAAISVLATVGCAGPSESGGNSSDDNFNVLGMAPISGPLSKIGAGIMSGFEAAVDVVNENGGIDGRQVEVKWVDTTSAASEAVSRLQAELSTGDKPDLVLPSVVSSETIAMLPVLTQNQILSIGTAAGTSTTNPEDWPYHFNTAVQAKDAIGSVVGYLEEQGYDSVAVALPDSELGRDKWDAFEELADEAGIEVAHEIIDPASVDPTAELSRLKGSGADALVLAGALGPSGGALVNAYMKLGWDVPVILDDATASNDYSALPEADLESMVFQVGRYAVESDPLRESDAYVKFWEAFLEHEETFDQGPDIYVYPYSTLILAKAGFEAADSTSVEDVAAAIENIQSADSDLWIMNGALKVHDDNHSIVTTPDDMVFIPGAVLNEYGLFVDQAAP